MMRRMVFDSLAALLLFAACVSAWVLAGDARAPSRVNIRFAAMLLAALCVAWLPGLVLPGWQVLAPVVALIVAPLASTLLALGLIGFLVRPVPVGAAALGLALSLAAGLAAALSGAPAFAALCQIAGGGLIGAAVFKNFEATRAAGAALAGLLAALALLCSGFALMDDAINLAEMFLAAALIGMASQTRVEPQAESNPRMAVKARW
jgi:hypothetical protein